MPWGGWAVGKGQCVLAQGVALQQVMENALRQENILAAWFPQAQGCTPCQKSPENSPQGGTGMAGEAGGAVLARYKPVLLPWERAACPITAFPPCFFKGR